MVLSGQNLRSHSLCQAPAMHAPPDGETREAGDSARCCSSPGINSPSMLLGGTRPNSRYKSTRDGTRAHNLLLRGEAPYPLGHTSIPDHSLAATVRYYSWRAAQRTAGPKQHPQGMAGGHTTGGPHGQMTGRAYSHTAHTPGVANTDADASACARACEETRGQIPRIHPLHAHTQEAFA